MIIKDSITGDLDLVNRYINRYIKHDISAIAHIGRHLIDSGGKRIRPYLVITTSRMFDVPVDAYVKVAAAIEMYHSASLLHDDVVDNAKQRRGSPSANNIWGNKRSVLVGDFLLAASSSIIAGMKNDDLLGTFIRVLSLMAEGELIQLGLSRNTGLSQKDYYTIIKKKTAYLFSLSCESGAIMGRAPDTVRRTMRQFGLLLGIAFQLIDDNIDYVSSARVSGKGRGVDLKEGKITLPMITALSGADRKEKAVLGRALAGTTDKGSFADVYGIIEKYHGFEYTKRRAESFAHRAIGLLDGLPVSPEIEELRSFALSVVERKS
ncbi:MAG: polyprenyl synthetase family protein [Deltaproteobacteria bacterium]|nr:polyprenyl synthetase family protein [Deltaproteobacteria bacterium]MCL5278225.1 polyprenyl synthetase family protein [Deltaproteobacteria bacterium]